MSLNIYFLTGIFCILLKIGSKRYYLNVCNTVFNYAQETMKKRNNNKNNIKTRSKATNFPIYKSEKENTIEIFTKLIHKDSKSIDLEMYVSKTTI